MSFAGRSHGAPPYRIAAIHGGPGAAGAVRGISEGLLPHYSSLEPFQTADSVEGETDELIEVLSTHAVPTVVLIGASWGAWLSCLAAARAPELVKVLVLVGTPPFDTYAAKKIEALRMARMTPADRRRLEALGPLLEGGTPAESDRAFRALSEIYARTDAFDPFPEGSDVDQPSFELLKKVWGEADEMRRDGRLMATIRTLRCPVHLIHGEYDPHPFEGARLPLIQAGLGVTSHPLSRCGHQPWHERQAREEFFRILRQILAEEIR